MEIKQLIDNVPSIIYSVDIETYELLYTNENAEILVNEAKDMLEYSDGNNPLKCYEAIYGYESPCLFCKIQELLPYEESKVIGYEVFNDIDNKWYAINDMMIRDEEDKIIKYTMGHDITPYKSAQQNLTTTYAQLIKSNGEIKLLNKELEEYQEELKLLASTDPMTQLYNRRYFAKVSEHTIDLARRDNKEVSILMLDIDKFKNINDTYGHDVGDTVIISLADKLKEYQRKSDIVCRFGGEEFVILLPNTTIEHANIVAQKIRSKVEDSSINIENNKIVKFTVSIGISQVNIKTERNLEKVLKRSDLALYDAKESGRNKVCTRV